MLPNAIKLLAFYVAMLCASHATASDTPITLRVRSFEYDDSKPPMWMSRVLSSSDTSDEETGTSTPTTSAPTPAPAPCTVDDNIRDDIKYDCGVCAPGAVNKTAEIMASCEAESSMCQHFLDVEDADGHESCMMECFLMGYETECLLGAQQDEIWCCQDGDSCTFWATETKCADI